MNLQSEDRVPAAQQYVLSKFPHAVENERFGKFMSYRVPTTDVQSLGRVFERLEAGALSTPLDAHCTALLSTANKTSKR